jgi:hypothetical protein
MIRRASTAINGPPKPGGRLTLLVLAFVCGLAGAEARQPLGELICRGLEVFGPSGEKVIALRANGDIDLNGRLIVREGAGPRGDRSGRDLIAIVDKLGSRLDALSERVDMVEPRLQRVEVGQTPGSDYNNPEWKLHIPTGEYQSQPYTVKFSRPFVGPPRVVVGLCRLDSDAHTRIEVNVTSIKETEFEYRITTWADTKVFAAAVIWAAVGEPDRPAAQVPAPKP